MTILVTGATGGVGRMVVDHLLTAGATDVRALTVDPDRARLPAGVEVVRGHMGRPDALRTALHGADRMYLAPQPSTVETTVAAAAEAGVRHIVDLSGEHESWWGSVARAVESAGPAWTHLWPGDFMENVGSWAGQIRATGEVREPWPDSATAPIAMTDVAAVAAAALLGHAHEGCAHSLTGPQTLTRRELLAHLGRALGRDLTFVEASRDDTVDALRPTMGESADWYVDSVLGGVAGYAVAATDLVARLTGRPATTFARWADLNAHTVIGVGAGAGPSTRGVNGRRC